MASPSVMSDSSVPDILWPQHWLCRACTRRIGVGGRLVVDAAQLMVACRFGHLAVAVKKLVPVGRADRNGDPSRCPVCGESCSEDHEHCRILRQAEKSLLPVVGWSSSDPVLVTGLSQLQGLGEVIDGSLLDVLRHHCWIRAALFAAGGDPHPTIWGQVRHEWIDLLGDEGALALSCLK